MAGILIVTECEEISEIIAAVFALQVEITSKRSKNQYLAGL